MPLSPFTPSLLHPPLPSRRLLPRGCKLTRATPCQAPRRLQTGQFSHLLRDTWHDKLPPPQARTLAAASERGSLALCLLLLLFNLRRLPCNSVVNPPVCPCAGPRARPGSWQESVTRCRLYETFRSDLEQPPAPHPHKKIVIQFYYMLKLGFHRMHSGDIYINEYGQFHMITHQQRQNPENGLLALYLQPPANKRFLCFRLTATKTEAFL